MVLSIRGLTCAGTLTRAPAIERLVSPRVTCAARFGSKCQAAASFGRAVMVTLPLISALALSALMLTLPICLATLPPSRPPSASLTAPVAFDDSEPVAFSAPVSGVASDSTSWAPVAVIAPRDALQPISAFCRICDTGLSALPAKARAARRQPVHGLQADEKRDRDHRGREQDRFETYRQTHYVPGLIEPESLQGGSWWRQSGRGVQLGH